MTGTSISKEPREDTPARVCSADGDSGSEGRRLRRGREVLLAELDEAKFS